MKYVRIRYISGHQEGQVSVVDRVKAEGRIRRGLAVECDSTFEQRVEEPAAEPVVSYSWDHSEPEVDEDETEPDEEVDADG